MSPVVSPALRTARERLHQTLCFEAGGLLLVTPLVVMATGQSAHESVALLAALSVAVMAWAAAFNTAFDVVEHRLTGRVASARPSRWRLLHALLHEGSAVLVTWPLIVALTGLDWGTALLADLGLTLVYAAYAYAFHRVYDWWRPVGATAA